MRNSNTLQAFWLALGNFSSFLLAILSAAILSRYLIKADYGTYRQIVYVYSTLLVIFTAGLPSVFSYFLPRFSLNQGKDIVKKVSKLLFFAGVLFAIFLFCFSEIIAKILKNPDLGIALKIFSPVPMLLLPTLGIEGIFASYKKTSYIAIYNIVTKIISLLLITLPVIVFHKSYIFALYGWNIASFLSFLIAFYIKKIPFNNIENEKSNITLREIFSYSLPLVSASLWGIAIKAADQFYVSRYFGSEIFAEFSNGFVEIPIVAMVTGAIATILLPVFSKMFFENSRTEDFVEIYRNVIQKSAMIIYPMVIFFMFNSESIIVTLYSSKYLNSVVYFQIAVILNFFNIIVFAPLIMAMGKTKFYSRLHMFIAFGAWGLGYITILTFNSPIALAIFSVSLSILKVVIAFIFVSKYIRVSIVKLIPLKPIISYILHAIVVIIIVKFLLIRLLPQADIFVKLIISFLSYLTVMLATGIPLKLNYISIVTPFFGRTKEILK